MVSGFNAAPLHHRPPPLSLKEEHWWQLVNSPGLFGMTCIPILLSPYVIWGQILNVQDLRVSFLVPLVQGWEGWTLSRHSTSRGFTSLPLERWGSWGTGPCLSPAFHTESCVHTKSQEELQGEDSSLSANAEINWLVMRLIDLNGRSMHFKFFFIIQSCFLF